MGGGVAGILGGERQWMEVYGDEAQLMNTPQFRQEIGRGDSLPFLASLPPHRQEGQFQSLARNEVIYND